MPRKRKQNLDLATVFQAVSSNLAEQQSSLNQADSYNHNHGDNMVEIFGAINEAIAAKQGEKPAKQLAYASELVSQRSQSGSAQLYASGLSQAAQQFKGKSVTSKNAGALLQALLGGATGGQAGGPGTGSSAMTDLLGGLLGGQAGASQGSGSAADLLGSLLGGAAGGPGGGQAGGSLPSTIPADLLGSLLGGATGGQAGASQGSGSAADLLGSLLGGAAGSPGTGGQASGSQPGLDMGDLLNAGMAFVSAQQQGAGTLEAIIKAFVAATRAGQSPHRAQSGEVVASTLVQMMAGGRQP